MTLPNTSRGVQPLVKHLAGLKSMIVAGGAAGNLTATGIATADTLVAVVALPVKYSVLATGANASGAPANVAVANMLATSRLRLATSFAAGVAGPTGAVSDVTAKYTAGAAVASQADTDLSAAKVLFEFENPSLNLTAEFTISAANQINNTGGTATTGRDLLVQYFDDSSYAAT